MKTLAKALTLAASLGTAVSIAPAVAAEPALPSNPLEQFLPDLQPAGEVNPDSTETYVSLGDSLAANPTALDILMSRAKNMNPAIQWPTIQEGRCAQSPNNFPRQAAAQTGLRLADYSCGGSTAYTETTAQDAIPHNTLSDQVEQAKNENNLNGDTRLVTITIGVNDLYQPSSLNSTQEDRQRRYNETVTAQIEQVKAAAPNAKVVVLGLPDQTDGFNHTCATNLLGTVSHWYFPIVSYYQDELRNEQRQAASDTGSIYLDMVDEINAAKNNNGCAPEKGRLSAAVFDDEPHNLTFHLTDAGHKYYADRITATYRG